MFINKTIARVGYAMITSESNAGVEYDENITWFESGEAGGREFKASQIDRALTDKRIELTWQTEREDYEREREQDNDLEQGWGRIFKR